MELLRALAALAEAPAIEHGGLAELLDLSPLPPPSDHSELFLFQLQPYASIYLGAEGMIGGEARDRVAGFWRALGETPPVEPDHLSTLLALQARLADLERGATDSEQRRRWHRGRSVFLCEHLLSWLPAYFCKLDEIAGEFHRGWGELVREALREELQSVGRQDLLPLHLREAPQMADPRQEGGEAFLAALLSPVRSGMILVRADLARAARDLGLGLRAGERAYALRALFSQAAQPVLAWLTGEATRWRDLHRKPFVPIGPVAEFWAERADRTASLLAALRAAG